MKARRGFTLIELMIVVLVIAVLAGLAMTAYTKQVRKSKRAEAKQVLVDLALRQEKYRSNHTTYGSLAQLGGAAATTYYSICPVPANCTATATGFILIAQPTGDQAADSCGTLRFQSASGTITKLPAGCW